MKYSLRSLMIAVLVLPPLLAWGGMPIYRWLATPKPEPLSISPLHAYDPELYGVSIGYPSPEKWEELIAEDRVRKAKAPAPNPPKP